MYCEDTIAAVATPAGSGGVGIIRISGSAATTIAAAVFASAQPAGTWESHRLHHGRFVDSDGTVIDDGLAVLMRRPHSYTGEDVLELHCHGSPVVLRRVLATVLSCGARLAEPGEFTKRAFLNGKLDLAQAEAVIDLVRARSDAGAAAAAAQLTGQLSGALETARRQLIRLKALLEAQIDFAEEDVAVVPGTLLALLGDSQEGINRLIDTYKYGRLLRHGVRIAIVGKPNVGKSSLLNVLLGEDRALVTPVAGTTRDTIEETVDFDGVPVVLTDTAGLRPDAGDVVERLGMARTTAAISGAQLLLTVLDASRPLDSDDYAVLKAACGVRQLVVLNKTDLGVTLAADEVARLAHEHAVVEVSAKERRGLNELRSKVVQLIGDGGQRMDGEPVLTNLRHHAALVSARQSLDLAQGSICDCRPPDLVAVDVQDALDRIGEITGTITSEDVLESIFSEFCIGK